MMSKVNHRASCRRYRRGPTFFGCGACSAQLIELQVFGTCSFARSCLRYLDWSLGARDLCSGSSGILQSPTSATMHSKCLRDGLYSTFQLVNCSHCAYRKLKGLFLSSCLKVQRLGERVMAPLPIDLFTVNSWCFARMHSSCDQIVPISSHVATTVRLTCWAYLREPSKMLQFLYRSHVKVFNRLHFAQEV